MIKLWKTLTLIIAFAAGTLLLTIVNQPAAAAEKGLIPLESFGHLPSVGRPALSPDGMRVATFIEYEGRLSLAVLAIHPSLKEKPKILPMKGAEFNWVRWVNNDRLIGSVVIANTTFGIDTTETRLFGIDRDGKNLKVFRLFDRNLRWIPMSQDRVIDFLPEDDRHVLIVLDKDGPDDHAVYSMDTNTGILKMVERPEPNIRNWMTDGDGNVRLGYGGDPKLLISYIVARRSADANLERLIGKDPKKGITFSPAGLDCTNPSRFYVYSSHENGNSGLYLYDMDENEIIEKIFLHSKYDISRAIFGKRDNCLVGVSYIENAVKTIYFEEPYATIQAQLQATFPGLGVGLSTSSADQRYWIIRVGTSQQPTQYYYYDLEAGSISLWAETYPGLNESNMMPSTPVSFQSRDGVEIPGYLIYPQGGKRENLPTIVMPHGGPASRDTASFDFWAQFLANRGYLVFKPNFRGSSGFGEDFQADALATWGGTATNDIEDGAKWLVSQGIADPDRMCIVGGSYGGYAALMSIIQSQEFYKCAISLNGVSDPVALVNFYKRFQNTKGIDDIIVGDRKKRDLKNFSPYHRAKEIQVPVLLLHTTKDRNVRYNQSASMAQQLKKYKKDYRFVTLKDDSHYLEWEKNRMIFLKEMEAFLAKHIGAE